MRLLAQIIALFGFAASAQADVTVFAAASTMTALEDVAAQYEAASGEAVTLSFAGSSALARQIEMGAPADVFLSANVGWMDHLESMGRIAPATRRDLLSNRLVLIGREAGPEIELSATTDLAGLLGGGYLAMALVEAVPAGIYGKAALETLGLWDAVSGQVAQTDHARAALMLVASGAAPFGVVYASDARADPRVVLRGTFPKSSHPPITYPVAAIAGREDAAEEFLTWLASDPARAVFAAQGFEVLP